MRNILLISKLLAKEEGSSEIKLEHLQHAMKYLKPKPNSRYHIFQNYANTVGSYVREERFSEVDIDYASTLPKIDYSEEVIELLNTLAGRDLTTGTELTVLYFDKSKVKGRYVKLLEQATELKGFLEGRLYNQEHAVEAVSDAIVRMRWGNAESRPSAIFSFLGPPATGKTYLAKLIGDGLHGYVFRSFDMAQFENSNEGFGLVGSRQGYNDATAGDLTTFVKENPKSVIVFDEIEKCHSGVQSAILQMLSEGFLQDNFSKEIIDFRQTIVIFTSNLGSSIYSSRSFSELNQAQPEKARSQLLEALKKEVKYEDGNSVPALRSEFISRLSQGSVILFNTLSIKSLALIAKKQIAADSELFEEKMGIDIKFDKLTQLCQLFVFMFAPSFDAREIKARISHLLFDPITDFLIASNNENIEKVSVSIDESSFSLLKSFSLEAMRKQMGIKHETLLLEPHITESASSLEVTFSNAHIAKLSSSDDYLDASGILIDIPEISFSDIAGHERIKSRLQETVCLLKNRDKLQENKLSTPKGMLLYGKPGTGKTMLAKAVAHEAELPFISCTGNDLLSKEFIGKLFARAREYAPSIIFIDEIDSLPIRGEAGPAADVLINNILVEIDGFNTQDEIFIIAATNRKELIDPAILRSGRIDLHYEVPSLDKKARSWFIDRMLNNALFSIDINPQELLQLSAGFSGADFDKLNREVILAALRDNVDLITSERIIEQINILKYGETITSDESALLLQETAYHEAGHAVASMVLLPERRIEQVTVTARANFKGMVSYDREQELDHTRDFLFGLTCVALAGRIAQMKKFGPSGLDTGAESDLEQATSLAWHAISTYGMDDDFFNISLSTLERHSDRAPFANQVELRVKHWIDEACEKAETIIGQHWESIALVAETLLNDEVMTEDQLKAILAG